MSKTIPMSVRLEEALSQELAAIAVALGRPKSWVIEQALKEFIATQQWQLAAIDEGIKAADKSRVVAHEDVAAWVGSWGRSGELPCRNANSLDRAGISPSRSGTDLHRTGQPAGSRKAG